MTEPSKKSPSVERLLEGTFGRSTAIRSDHCASCKREAVEFKDDLSRREYAISGLCQACQDSVFGGGEEY